MAHVNREKYEYGMDKGLKAKFESKFSPQRAAQAQAWLEAVVGTRFPAGWHDSLKSGIILCKAINRIKPGSVKKISTSSMPFNQRENIAAYLRGCKALGMKSHNLFDTQDLFEGNNLVPVVDNIFTLGGIAQKIGFRGPKLGVKEHSENPRGFTQQFLKEKAVVGTRQTQGDYGYTDETRNPVLARQIIKNPLGIHQHEGATRWTEGAPKVDKGHGLDKIVRNPEQVAAQRGARPAAGGGGGKFCSNCGAARKGAAKFCGGCGNKF